MDIKRAILLQFMADDGLDANILAQIAELTQFSTELIPEQPSIVQKKKFFKLSYNNDQFEEHFRMRRTTFEVLLNVVGHHHLEVEEALPQDNVLLNKKILFTLWVLSTQETFNEVCKRFNMPIATGRSTFKSIVYILAKIMPSYVKWPSATQQTNIAQTFETRSQGIPGIIGVIDTFHVSIKKPMRRAEDYFNRQKFFSIILQGVCDSSERLIDVFIGTPGGNDDVGVFRSSPLFKKLTSSQNPLLQPSQHLIAGTAYPLLKTLLKPFHDNGKLIFEQVLFNRRLNEVLGTIERAFERLKSKFQRLKYVNIGGDVEMDNHVMAAACMLHNFIIDNEEMQERAETEEAEEKRNNILRNL